MEFRELMSNEDEEKDYRFDEYNLNYSRTVNSYFF